MNGHELNLKTADALVTMPKLREFAFSPVRAESVNLLIFVKRTGSLPDGTHQVYALDQHKLRVIGARASRVIGTFEYVLSVSPLAPRKIWAAVIDIPATSNQPDPLIEIHAAEMAERTIGTTVIHFLDEGRMRDFVVGVSA